MIDHDEMLDVELTRRPRREEAAGDVPILRPIFEPGDALFFDELFLHQTALGSRRCRTRASRSRAGSSAARRSRGDYAPLAV